MQQNNFEHSVHTILDGFTIPPSSEAWSKVEAQLQQHRNKKNKILPLFFICCFLFSVLLLHDLRVTQNTPAILSADKKEINSKAASENNTSGIHTKQTGTKNHHTSGRKVLAYQYYSAKINNKLIKLKAEKEISSFVRERSDVMKEILSNVEIQNSIPPAKKIASLQIIDNSQTAIKEAAPMQQQVADTFIKNEQTKIKIREKKWTFSAAVSAGLFATGSGYFNSDANAFYSDVISAAPGSGNPNIFTPSAIKPSLSFSATVMAYKKLSAATSIGIGIQYRFGQTYRKVGEVFETEQVRGNFLTGNSTIYKNQFYFIELPLSMEFKIGNGKNHPVSFDAGILYSRLLHTNALQFNGVSGIYYKDNSLFNKNLISISTGFSISLLKNKPGLLTTGPALYYSLTPAASSGWYSKTHNSFLGINMRCRL